MTVDELLDEIKEKMAAALYESGSWIGITTCRRIANQMLSIETEALRITAVWKKGEAPVLENDGTPEAIMAETEDAGKVAQYAFTLSHKLALLLGYVQEVKDAVS